MKSLLPPNASYFEKALEAATKFSVDSGLLKGFKFKDNHQIIIYLIWEYNLNDVLSYIKDGGNIISDGLIFQRTRGTKSAIKIAAKWADLDNIDIYEEEPSSHFYEFQIGVKDRQFDFDVHILKNVTNLAKPIRSRLSRIYNDLHDVRYFQLDGSQFGDILSDYSGVKLNDLTLSFGRNNSGSINYDGDFSTLGITRIHEIKSAADRIYRLDFAVLGETEPDINSIKIEYQKQRVYRNRSSICASDFDIDKYATFAKAAIVLSEDSVLCDTNSCLNPLEIIESNQVFVLGFDMLSEHLWSFEDRPILERFDNNISSYSDFSRIEYTCTNPVYNRDFAKVIPFFSAAALANSRVSTINSSYKTNPYWSEHRHSDKPWCDEVYVAKISI